MKQCIFLLGLAAALMLSGCGSEGQPAAGTVQAPAPEKAPAAAAASETNAGAEAPPADAAQPAEAASAEGAEPTAQGADKPPVPGAGAQPGAASAGQALPGAAPAQAAQPGDAADGPAAGGAAAPPAALPAGEAAAVPAPAGAASSAAAQPTAAEPAVPAQPASAEAPAPVPAELTIRITGDGAREILQETSVSFQDGATVLDVLKQAAKANKLQMEFQGKGAYAYVQGIDNLYEFDQGPKSGWVYKVNGQAPSEGAGAYKLQAGDRIEWFYTLDLGEDVGAKMK
ncbi:DUF4430 domain-containing protein [Paenibacillus sp. S-38]|uniref:DUF4430 domain-containing protein n=1 Tax=Paenibacillus sp. S-38 TaxID=3416710 RepID=UPI003CE8887C